MTDFIEQQIIDAVRKLLTGRVNEKLNDYNFFFPLLEFSNYSGNSPAGIRVAAGDCYLVLPGGEMNWTIIFPIIAAVIAVGGILVTIGVFKNRISHNAETNKAQDEQMKKFVSRDDLAAAIKRSDELLALMKERAEEDRAKGQGQYREFYALLTGQEKRIIALETQQTAFAKSLDEMKHDIKSGFKDLQTELKELQKEIQKSRGQG
jgi:hypothetical protein